MRRDSALTGRRASPTLVLATTHAPAPSSPFHLLARGPRFLYEFHETMHTRSAGPGAGTRDRLYAEFAQFYTSERCPWAPANPLRVFKLAFGKTLREHRRGLSDEQLLATVYTVLGFHGHDRKGLFQTFDPAKYKGTRHTEDHFVSLFARKLKGRLLAMRRRTTDTGRAGDPALFPCNPALGLVHERLAPASERARVSELPVVLAGLEPRERAVVHLLYWSDLSARKVGALLDLDHKTVAKVHGTAVRKLRRLYGVEENLAA